MNCTNGAYYVGGCDTYDPDYWYGGPDPALKAQNGGRFLSHGTKVAGIISALTNNQYDYSQPPENNSDIAGLAPNIVVLPIRLHCVHGDNGWGISRDSIYKAYKAMFDCFKTWQWTEHVRVVNNSYSGPKYSSAFKSIILDDQRRYDRLYIGSAGNASLHVKNYPAAYDCVLGVSGIWRVTNPGPGESDWCSYIIPGGGSALGSNYFNDSYGTYEVSGVFGWTTSERNEELDVGQSLDVPTAIQEIDPYNDMAARTARFGHTSACAPQVSALAALLFTKNPYPTNEMVRAHIISTRDTSTDSPRGELPIAGIIDYDEALSTW